ncbi:MAG: high-affinity Fe2+/Pb2+ permease precursor [Gammaproteobacteria bacterium]|nr:high-affinity Fe2+/Pb2+ permease precursor [Gammaproteobacteria bacterium]
MRRILFQMRTLLIVISILCTWGQGVPARAEVPNVGGNPSESEEQVSQTWQILDYLADDYRGAVDNGRIISASEYAEMREFAGTIRTQLHALPTVPASSQLHDAAERLARSIGDKDAAEVVATEAHSLADALLVAYPIPTAPLATPDLARGARIYATTCAGCHGADGHGDGPAGAQLQPRPVAFTDRTRAAERSVLSLYQAVTHGVPGTAMPGFPQISTADRWAVAFHVGRLAYAPYVRAGEDRWQRDSALRAHVPDLKALVRAREDQWTPLFGADGAAALLGYLRTHPEALAAGPHGIALARTQLAASVAAYRRGRSEDAARLALSAYLDGIEPIEPALAARNDNLRIQLETDMAQYRAAILDHASAAVAAQADDLNRLLDAVDQELGASRATPTTAFLGSYTILVREGLEALLIVVAMIAFLRKAHRNDAVRYVHIGWTLALVAGAVTWVVATYVIAVSGAGREVTEGLSSLFAAVVLLGVGIWMHQKSVGGRWQAYLRAKLSAALDRRSMVFLFGLSFVAVYREVFETILFYAALWTEGQKAAIGAGLFAGAITLVAVAWVLLRTSRRLPVGTFFAASSLLIAVLALVLTGKGMQALQEAGWLATTPVAFPRIDWLGVFPSQQSLSAQALILLVVIVAYFINRRRAAPGT